MAEGAALIADALQGMLDHGEPVRDERPSIERTAAPPSSGIRRASSMPVPDPPRWLAPGWLLREKVCVLTGDEGIGKSLAWTVMAMHISTGLPERALGLPQREAGDVVVIATEDSWSEIRARLETAGADFDRIHLFCDADDELGVPEFPRDEARFREWAAETGVRPALIVVDAWLDTVPSGLQVKSPQSARKAIDPWKRIAAQSGAAVLLVTHTNRLETSDIRSRIGNTGALRQVARVLLFAARHPDDGRDGGPLHLWIGPEKANGARLANAVRFELSIEQQRPATASDPGTTATLIAARSEEQTIAHLVADWSRDQQQANRKPTKAQQAEAWLREYMQGRGLVLSNDVRAAGAAAGFGQTKVSDAMSALGDSAPPSPGAPWLYSLTTMSEDCSKTAISTETAR